MTSHTEILQYLRPNGGWVISDDNFDTALFIECEPVTRAEFDATIEIYETIKENEKNAKIAAKAALLEKLGITEEEAKLLLS